MIMKNLFIVDPLELIEKKMGNDSSTAIIKAGLKRGHIFFVAEISDLILRGSDLNVYCRKVLKITDKGYKLGEVKTMSANDFQVIWLRKNPPFDETYLMHLAVFDQLSRHKILFINNPEIVRELNEKLTILNFPKYIIDTIVTMNLDEIKKFWQKYKKIVVKGLTGFGGDSVILIENWQKDFMKLKRLSQDGSRFLMAQKFIANVHNGDKRVTILNGKVAGVLVRVPPKDSFIAYTGGGATVHKTELNKSELKIANDVAKFLKKRGIFWGGLDLIDGYLSEVNLTSPSFLAAANSKFNIGMENIIWDEVEDVIKQLN